MMQLEDNKMIHYLFNFDNFTLATSTIGELFRYSKEDRKWVMIEPVMPPPFNVEDI